MILFVLHKFMMFRLMLLISFFTFSIALPLEILLEGNSCSLELRRVQRASKLIAGGREARKGEFPYQVALYEDFSFCCGGSILSKKWILTAAHCVYEVPSSHLYIKAGVTNHYDFKATTRWIRRVVIHDNYTNISHENDIGLLELREPLPIGVHIKSVPLSTRKNLVNKLATATGWGRLKEGGTYSDNLMAVDVPIISNFRCRKKLPWKIANTMLCAGYEDGGKDTCEGDSGGPLVIYENGKRRLVGITSKGIGCARPGKAGIYTRVSKFVNWIKRYVS